MFQVWTVIASLTLLFLTAILDMLVVYTAADIVLDAASESTVALVGLTVSAAALAPACDVCHKTFHLSF